MAGRSRSDNASKSSSASSASPAGSVTAASRAKYSYEDQSCLNCGRCGVISGQMVRGADGSTYCSADCGWSHMIRIADSEQMSAVAASRRNSASTNVRSRNGNRSATRASSSRHGTSGSGRHAKKPPRCPRGGPTATEAQSVHGHAMFDFSLRFHPE